MVFRGFQGANQSSPTDHTVGKADCQVTANKEGGELIRISQSKHAQRNGNEKLQWCKVQPN